MREFAPGPVPSLKDRIPVVAGEPLVPESLTADEARTLIRTIADHVQPDADVLKSFYDHLATVEADSVLPLLPVAVAFPHEENSLFRNVPIIFDRYDDVYVSLFRPDLPDLSPHKRRHLEARFKKKNGRPPNENELDSLTYAPGYQLQVLGRDSSRKAALKKQLLATGFPVSEYRGLASSKTESEVPIDLTRAGRASGDFQQVFNHVLTELHQSTALGQWVLDGKLTPTELQELRRTPEKMRKLALRITFGMYVDGRKRESPELTDADLQAELVALQALILMGKI